MTAELHSGDFIKVEYMATTRPDGWFFAFLNHAALQEQLANGDDSELEEIRVKFVDGTFFLFLERKEYLMEHHYPEFSFQEYHITKQPLELYKVLGPDGKVYWLNPSFVKIKK